MLNCPICNSSLTEKVLLWDIYSVNRCSDCRLVFTTPVPSDEVLLDFYQGFMFRTPADRDIVRQTEQKKSELIRLFNLEVAGRCANKNFLDYGGGTGVTYNAAVQLGLDAYYHDLDRQAIKFVSDRFELLSSHLIEAPLNDVVLFDYIVSDNVIEHVQDPIKFLKDLYDVLRDGGTMVIKTPHAGNSEVWFNPAISIKVYFFKAMKYNSIPSSIKAFFKRFWHCDPPRHLYSFSEGSLKALMERLSIPADSYEISYYHAPFFSNTITEHIFKSHGRFEGRKLIILRMLALPIVPIEAVLQVIVWVLIKIKLVSQGGIRLKIVKGTI